MELTLKGLKTGNGPDGLTLECSVYIEGKRRFLASNDGWGGCNLYQPVKPYAENRAWLEKAEAWAKTQPPHTFTVGDHEYTVECDLDIVIGDLIEQEMDRRWLKSQCRRNTLFRTPEDDPAQGWRVLKHQYSEAVRDWLNARYPGAVIANDAV